MAAAPGAASLFLGLTADWWLYSAVASGRALRYGVALSARRSQQHWYGSAACARSKNQAEKTSWRGQSFVRFELESEPPWRLRRAPRLYFWRLTAERGADFISAWWRSGQPRSGMGSRSARGGRNSTGMALRRVRARKIRQKKPAGAAKARKQGDV